MMADSRQTPPKVGDGSDEEYQYKRLILEQACYYCQHNIIQHFMPEDITTFGLNPILPAMATLHGITTRHHNDHLTGQAVTLLQFVHSQIPEPSLELQKDYIEILISLKSKAVFYEVFSSDNWYADDKQRFAILDKYFGSNSLVESCSIPEECSTTGEYDLAMHTCVDHAIRSHLSSEHWRKDFQQSCLLDSSKSMALWESLAKHVNDYVAKIRKLLPLPQLVINYFKFNEDVQSTLDSGSNENSDSEPTTPSQSYTTSCNIPKKISLRRVTIPIKRIPIRLLDDSSKSYILANSSEDEAYSPSPSTDILSTSERGSSSDEEYNLGWTRRNGRLRNRKSLTTSSYLLRGRTDSSTSSELHSDFIEASSDSNEPSKETHEKQRLSRRQRQMQSHKLKSIQQDNVGDDGSSDTVLSLEELLDKSGNDSMDETTGMRLRRSYTDSRTNSEKNPYPRKMSSRRLFQADENREQNENKSPKQNEIPAFNAANSEDQNLAIRKQEKCEEQTVMDWENWEQNCHADTSAGNECSSPHVLCNTPNLVVSDIRVQDPKQARMITSTARLKGFLNSSETSSDEASYYLRSNKKQYKVEIDLKAFHGGTACNGVSRVPSVSKYHSNKSKLFKGKEIIKSLHGEDGDPVSSSFLNPPADNLENIDCTPSSSPKPQVTESTKQATAFGTKQSLPSRTSPMASTVSNCDHTITSNDTLKNHLNPTADNEGKGGGENVSNPSPTDIALMKASESPLLESSRKGNQMNIKQTLSKFHAVDTYLNSAHSSTSSNGKLTKSEVKKQRGGPRKQQSGSAIKRKRGRLLKNRNQLYDTALQNPQTLVERKSKNCMQEPIPPIVHLSRTILTPTNDDESIAIETGSQSSLIHDSAYSVTGTTNEHGEILVSSTPEIMSIECTESTIEHTESTVEPQSKATLDKKLPLILSKKRTANFITYLSDPQSDQLYQSPELPLTSVHSSIQRRNKRLCKTMGSGEETIEPAGATKPDNVRHVGKGSTPQPQHQTDVNNAENMKEVIECFIHDALASELSISPPAQVLYSPAKNNSMAPTWSVSTEPCGKSNLSSSDGHKDNSNTRDCDIVSDSTVDTDDETPMSKSSLLHELYKLKFSLNKTNI